MPAALFPSSPNSKERHNTRSILARNGTSVELNADGGEGDKYDGER